MIFNLQVTWEGGCVYPGVLGATDEDGRIIRFFDLMLCLVVSMSVSHFDKFMKLYDCEILKRCLQDLLHHNLTITFTFQAGNLCSRQTIIAVDFFSWIQAEYFS